MELKAKLTKPFGKIDDDNYYFYPRGTILSVVDEETNWRVLDDLFSKQQDRLNSHILEIANQDEPEVSPEISPISSFVLDSAIRNDIFEYVKKHSKAGERNYFEILLNGKQSNIRLDTIMGILRISSVGITNDMEQTRFEAYIKKYPLVVQSNFDSGLGTTITSLFGVRVISHEISFRKRGRTLQTKNTLFTVNLKAGVFE